MNETPNAIQETDLSEDQVKLLRHLLDKRSRLFVLAVIGVIAIWLRVSVDILRFWYETHFVYSSFIYQMRPEKLEKLNMAFGTCMLMLLGFIIYFSRMFFRRILPLYKDTRRKQGVYHPRVIIRKSIPYHNRCFFFFDDLKIPFKEVDHTTYYAYQSGDTFPILTSKYSGTHIDEYLNMSVL